MLYPVELRSFVRTIGGTRTHNTRIKMYSESAVSRCLVRRSYGADVFSELLATVELRAGFEPATSSCDAL